MSSRMILGIVKRDDGTKQEFYFPKDKSSIDAGMFPEKFVERVSELINNPLGGFSGFPGFGGDGEYYKFKTTDLDYYKFMDFCSVYYEKLVEQFELNPDDYMGTPESTYKRMKQAIAEGDFNKDSKAFKLTCKQLSIKHTYKAIREFMRC